MGEHQAVGHQGLLFSLLETSKRNQFFKKSSIKPKLTLWRQGGKAMRSGYSSILAFSLLVEELLLSVRLESVCFLHPKKYIRI